MCHFPAGGGECHFVTQLNLIKPELSKTTTKHTKSVVKRGCETGGNSRLCYLPAVVLVNTHTQELFFGKVKLLWNSTCVK